MAHLHVCNACGRSFRCEGEDHDRPAWFWCDFKCPDRMFHQCGLVYVMDAEFLRLVDGVARYMEKPVVGAARPRDRALRCGSRAQGQREPGGS